MPLKVAPAPLRSAARQEAVQRNAVFLVRVMGEQGHFAAELGQVVEGAHRRLELVAHAMHVDHQPRRLLVYHDALETTDHAATPDRIGDPPARWAARRMKRMKTPPV